MNSITESLRTLAETAGARAIRECVDVVSLGTAGGLLLVRKDSGEGKKREAQSGAVANELLVGGQPFYICNW